MKLVPIAYKKKTSVLFNDDLTQGINQYSRPLEILSNSTILLLISKNGPVPAGYFVIKKFKFIGTLPNVLGYLTQQKEKHY